MLHPNDRSMCSAPYLPLLVSLFRHVLWATKAGFRPITYNALYAPYKDLANDWHLLSRPTGVCPKGLVLRVLRC